MKQEVPMNMTDLLSFFKWLNDDFFALPGSILFLGTALILTVKTGFMQFRALPHFFSLLIQGVQEKKYEKKTKNDDSINPFHALFTALSTSIGMGTVVGPTIAIVTGGPGALFWLVVYIFFASVTKFTEVTFAIHTRTKTKSGHIIGGPMEYLKAVSGFLALWYSFIMTILFIGWSGLQANTLASIYALEQVPHWIVGLSLAIFVFIALRGGAKRVGALASKLVPIMFVLYVSFALFILCKDIAAFKHALQLIQQNIFSASAPVGGFFGASVFQAMRFGVFRGIYISESGLGTASIPHAMSDAQYASDQGVLAMGSTIADMLLSILSGLLVLVTGIWTRGGFSDTLIYEVFKMHVPVVGQLILLTSITLFVLTTVLGNSFNGMQSFSAILGRRWMPMYLFLTLLCIFFGALMPVPLVWEMMDTLLVLAAIPNIIGLLILAFRFPNVLKLRK